jgi:Sld7 C-terminal domain
MLSFPSLPSLLSLCHHQYLPLSQTTSPETNTFFHSLLSTSPILPDLTYTFSLLLTTPDSQILITTQNTTLHARSLTTLLHPILNTKQESPEPGLPSDPRATHPLGTEEYAGQFIAVVSPQRLLARESSCSQFDAKLESPGRMNAKGRRERRVQSLLPDIARRRKAEMEIASANSSVSTGINMSSDRAEVDGERTRGMKMEVDMENPFDSNGMETRVRQNSVVRAREGSVLSRGREGSVLSRGREGSVLSRTRETSVLTRPLDPNIPRSRDPSRQGTILQTRDENISRDSSIPPPSTSTSHSSSSSTSHSSTETQTKQAIKQTVIVALRLHSIPPSNPDYKFLVSHTVSAAMFALRTKLREGRMVGMGEIGAVVEGLLEMFLR